MKKKIIAVLFAVYLVVMAGCTWLSQERHVENLPVVTL